MTGVHGVVGGRRLLVAGCWLGSRLVGLSVSLSTLLADVLCFLRGRGVFLFLFFFSAFVRGMYFVVALGWAGVRFCFFWVVRWLVLLAGGLRGLFLLSLLIVVVFLFAHTYIHLSRAVGRARRGGNMGSLRKWEEEGEEEEEEKRMKPIDVTVAPTSASSPVQSICLPCTYCTACT
ncbi:hypothetical protein BC567DRAFT_217070 [Phyllosticta citribraziliensis]